MSKNSFLARLTALTMIMGLTACVTNSGTVDTSGQSIKLEKKGKFVPTDSHFNTFIFLKPSPFYETQTVERDNGSVWTEYVGSFPKELVIQIKHANTVWYTPKSEERMLILDNFKQEFPNAAIVFTDKDYKKIDQLSPRIKGWIASNEKCNAGYVAKRLKTIGEARNDIGYSDTLVKFMSCGDAMTVSPAQFVQKIGLISDSEERIVAQKYKAIDFALTEEQEAMVIAINWPKVLEDQSGYLVLKKAHDDMQDFTTNFEAAKTSCQGTFKTNDMSGWSGTWTLSCLNGSNASGEWTKLGDDKGKSAIGKDSKGRDVFFRFKNI
ncbi:hypothetical protein [Thalassospira marina]|nr:hypothetical protein [Thalassospira marina]